MESRRRPRRGRLTDRADVALRDLRANRAGLDGARVTAALEEVDRHDGAAVATFRVRWEVPRIGAFAYRSRMLARETPDGWRVAWRPTGLHPALTRGPRRRSRSSGHGAG